MRPILLLFFVGCAALAEERPAPPESPVDTLTVTADRRESSVERDAASIEIIDNEDLHTRGDPVNVQDDLRRLPGIHVQQSGGGFGGTADISIRGTRSSETVLLIDGIPFNDPAGSVGSVDPIYFNPAGLERIEVVKGAQSGLYGSRAIGGVINLITAQPTEEQRYEARLEGGSYNTWRTEAEASGPISEHTGFALGFSGVDSEGYSVQTSPGAGGDPDGHEDDGFQRWGLNGKLQAHNEIGKVWLGLNTVSIEEDLDFTGPDDRVNTIEVDGYRTSAGGQAKLSEKNQIACDVAYNILDREFPGETLFDKTYDSEEWYASLRNTYTGVERLTVTLGFDGDWQSAEIATASGATNLDKHSQLIGIWSEGTYALPAAEFSLAGRYDEHSREGDATTYRAGAAGFLLERAIKIFGSLATGFRAPSLYELYDTTFASGNPDLRPQETTSYEIGHRSRIWPGVHLTNTWFRTDYHNAIQFDLATFTNSNSVSDTRVHGVENSLEFAHEHCPVETRLTYTWQDSDDGTGKSVRFTPEHLASIDATYRRRAAWARLGVERVWTRATGLTAPDPEKLAPYSILSMVLGWEFSHGWEVYARGENLTNEDFEYYPGYSTTRAAGYLGVIAHF